MILSLLRSRSMVLETLSNFIGNHKMTDQNQNYDPVQASLNAAAAAANQAPPAGHYVPPAAGTTPAVFQPQGGAVVNQNVKGGKLAISQMQKAGGNSMQVDHFLGVDKAGVHIRFPSDDPRYNTDGQIAVNPLVLLVDYATDVTPKYSIRVASGNSVKFFHSYDRVVMDDGVTPWDQVVAQCKQRDPKCRGDYPSIDIAGVLLEPAVLITGKVVVPAGKRVGFSTSIMNWAEYQVLHQQLTECDAVVEYDDNTMEGVVMIRVGHVGKTNKGGISYGCYSFTYLGKGDAGAPAAAPAAPVAAQAAPAQPTAPAAPVQPQPQPQPVEVAQPAAPVAPVAPITPAPDIAAQPAAPVQPGAIPGVPTAAPTAGAAPKRRSRKAAGEAQS